MIEGGQMMSTLLELVGFTLIAVGCALAWPPLGLIVGGLLLALVGYLGADR